MKQISFYQTCLSNLKSLHKKKNQQENEQEHLLVMNNSTLNCTLMFLNDLIRPELISCLL